MSSLLNDRLNRQYGITISIHNKHRTGKTLTALMLIVWYLLHRKHVKGVISNIKLDLSFIDMDDKYVPLKDIKMIKEEEYMNYIIFTDEFRRLCDSNMSSSFRNKFISTLLADTGKSKQIHILTDQHGMAVHNRVRENADIIMYPEMRQNNKVCNVKIFEGYRDYFWIKGNGWMKDWKVEFEYNASPYFKYYNTEEKVEDYLLTFTPEEYAEKFLGWLSRHKYDRHPDFLLKTSTLTLWKEQTGEYISNEQRSALMEWLRYNTELPITGRRNK